MNLNDAQSFAHEKMREYGLYEWSFGFDNAVRRFGVCNHTYKKIGVSRKLALVNEERIIHDTILHEIAHALTYGHGHDHVWKAKCVELGCRPIACKSSKDGIVHVEAKWTSYCDNGHSQPKYRRRRGISSCGRCDPTGYNPKYPIHYRKNY